MNVGGTPLWPGDAQIVNQRLQFADCRLHCSRHLRGETLTKDVGVRGLAADDPGSVRKDSQSPGKHEGSLR